MASEARITDKLARYTCDGQLTCAICKIAVKSNAAWALHVAGSMHVEQLKKLTQLLHLQKAKAQASAPPSAPVVPPAPAQVSSGLTLGYDSEDDDETTAPATASTPNTTTDAPASVALPSEDSFAFLFEEDEPFLSDAEVDWEGVEAPDDWMGDPDEYVEEEVARRREARRFEWVTAREARREAARAALSGVEMVDEAGAAWRFDGEEWVRVGSVGKEWRGEVRSGFTRSEGDAATSVEDSAVTEEGNATVIGDASLELAAFEKQLAADSERARERAAEGERAREEHEARAREASRREKEEALGSLRARVQEARERAVVAEEELKERKRKREEVSEGEEDDDDEEFDAEALVNWRGR